MNTVWNHLKNFFTHTSSCDGLCNQGRNCNCYSPSIGDCIIQLHSIASSLEEPEKMQVRLLADELAKIGNRIHEKNLENLKS